MPLKFERKFDPVENRHKLILKADLSESELDRVRQCLSNDRRDPAAIEKFLSEFRGCVLNRGFEQSLFHANAATVRQKRMELLKSLERSLKLAGSLMLAENIPPYADTGDALETLMRASEWGPMFAVRDSLRLQVEQDRPPGRGKPPEETAGPGLAYDVIELFEKYFSDPPKPLRRAGSLYKIIQTAFRFVGLSSRAPDRCIEKALLRRAELHPEN